MNITIEIKAPELAKAIESLAVALSGSPVKNLIVVPKEVPAETKGVLKDKVSKKQDPEPEPQPEKPEETAREVITAGKEESAAEGDAPEIKVETVRATLAKLSQAGKQAQVKEIITSVGKAKKLTEIDPSRYAAVLAAAEEIA
jgi:hypothetical protein